VTTVVSKPPALVGIALEQHSPSLLALLGSLRLFSPLPWPPVDNETCKRRGIKQTLCCCGALRGREKQSSKATHSHCSFLLGLLGLQSLGLHLSTHCCDLGGEVIDISEKLTRQQGDTRHATNAKKTQQHVVKNGPGTVRVVTKRLRRTFMLSGGSFFVSPNNFLKSSKLFTRASISFFIRETTFTQACATDLRENNTARFVAAWARTPVTFAHAPGCIAVKMVASRT